MRREKFSTVEYDSVVEKISSTLMSLEEQGELVITSTMSNSVAMAIFHTALEEWLEKASLENEPIECSMQYLLDQTCSEMSKRFQVNMIKQRKLLIHIMSCGVRREQSKRLLRYIGTKHPQKWQSVLITV